MVINVIYGELALNTFQDQPQTETKNFLPYNSIDNQSYD